MSYDVGNAWPNALQKELLKACLLKGTFAQEAWGKWVSCIDFDKVDFASYKLLSLVSRNPALAFLQDPIFEKCKGIYRRTWVENRVSWGKMVPILKGLTKMGVDRIVFLKGMAMILHFYRDFGVRVMGDIDILVRRKDLSIVAPFFQTPDWERPHWRGVDLENEDHLKRWHAMNFTHSSKFNLDLHWSFIQENSSFLDEAVLDDAQLLLLEEISLYVPNATDLLLQTCVHGVKYSPVPLIRWIADAMTILDTCKEGIDWDRLLHLATRAHVCMPLYFGLNYLQEQFEGKIPQNVLCKLKSLPSLRIERLEYQCNIRGYPRLAIWYRYCLNRGHLTIWSQISHVYGYLQARARLKNPWQVPFFIVYWMGRQMYRYMSRRASSSTWRISQLFFRVPW